MIERVIITRPSLLWMVGLDWEAVPYGFDPETDPIGYGPTPETATDELLEKMENDE